MIRFLFWNVCGVASLQERSRGKIRPLLPTDKRYRSLRRVLSLFCLRKEVDVLVLAESPFEGTLNLRGFVEAKTAIKPNGKTRCRLEAYYRSSVEVDLTDTFSRYVLHRMKVVSTGHPFLLMSAHLPSPMASSPKTRKENVKILVSDIRNKEYELKTNKTVLVGDLNFEPYDEVVIDGNYLNAVPTKIVASQKVRVLSHESVPYFYNPMWAHLTDQTVGPPGTYYRKTNEVDCRFWCLPDQVLLRPDLLDFWKDEYLQIVSQIGKISLLHEKGTPNQKRFSDHLPITFGLNL